MFILYILYILYIKREQFYTYTFPNTISFYAKGKIAPVAHTVCISNMLLDAKVFISLPVKYVL